MKKNIWWIILGIALVILAISLLIARRVNASDEQVCYGECPTIEFSSSHYVYANKVVDEAGYYTCSPTWTLYNTNHCKKWTGNHWSYKDADYHAPTYKCPEGYSNNPGHSNCRKLETFTKDIKYNKDEEGCVKPDAKDEGIPSWALDDYKKLPKEKDREVVSCEPESTPTPEPTVAPEPVHEALTNAGPPVCQDGSILSLPIAFKVLRAGDKATLTWFKTGGDLVNIYYKEVGQANWTHAVGDVPNMDPSNKYVIGGLKPALGYIFAIQQHQGCAGGQLAESVVVDGPTYFPVLWSFSFWQWSK